MSDFAATTGNEYAVEYKLLGRPERGRSPMGGIGATTWDYADLMELRKSESTQRVTELADNAL